MSGMTPNDDFFLTKLFVSFLPELHREWTIKWVRGEETRRRHPAGAVAVACTQGTEWEDYLSSGVKVTLGNRVRLYFEEKKTEKSTKKKELHKHMHILVYNQKFNILFEKHLSCEWLKADSSATVAVFQA